MNELALFAGTGGGLLGSVLLGHKTVCVVEIEPYCREVLLRRQRDGMLPLFPIWDDVKTFDGRPWRGIVDVVSAGFPCQPWSTAGARRGEADERNLWPDTLRIIREVQPVYAFLENVEAITFRRSGRPPFVGTVLADLAASGFNAVWDCIPALAVDAPHARWRWWCLAYPTGSGGSQQTGQYEAMGWPEQLVRYGESGFMADAHEQELERARGQVLQERADHATAESSPEGRRWWAVEPELGRVANGVAHRVDRIRGIGNGQVPAVVELAWQVLRSRLNAN